jgi:uncharacterized membrane protein SirB2
MVTYATLKLVHVSAVTISFCGFAARGLGVLSGAPWVRHRLARTLPHLIDTVLLASALGMLWLVRLRPWEQPWLRAKTIGLLVYIVLGVVALRPARSGHGGRRMNTRLVAWIGALTVFGYIVSVALTRTPLGALLWVQNVAGSRFSGA